MVTREPVTVNCERCRRDFTYIKFSDVSSRRYCTDCREVADRIAKRRAARRYNAVRRGPEHRRTFNAYQRAHSAVIRERGKATEHACYQCGEPAHDWAFIHGEHRVLSGYFHASPYGPPESYEPLCRGCHGAIDRERSANGVNDGEVFMFADALFEMLTGKKAR